MAGDKEMSSGVKEGAHCEFGSDGIIDQTQDAKAAEFASSKIDQALEQSLKELEMLEKFYQQRGKTERAVEISLTLRRMRRRSIESTNNSKNDPDMSQDGH